MTDNKNLISMQRIDPCASRILHKATHTSLYTFDLKSKAWQKTDIDGSIFIYERADKPFYSLMIVNKHSFSDFIEPLVPGMSVHREDKFIFLRKVDAEIKCLWIYHDEECRKIYELLQGILAKLMKEYVGPNKVPKSTNSPIPPSAPPPVDSSQLLELLKVAQSPSSSSNDRKISTPRAATLNHVKRDDPSPTADMPVLLQKLMVQEQPGFLAKAPAFMISADELEKDLVKSAKPKHNKFQDFINSSSAVSIAALSTRSVQGSVSEGEPDGIEVDSVGGRAQVDDPSFHIGSGDDVPVLNKDQFVYAISYLLKTDDQFVAQVHQAYVDAMNRRLRVDHSSDS